MYGNKLIIFGGSYTDNVFTIYYYNDIVIFNVDTKLWEGTTVYGTPPTVRWSHTATLVQSDLFFIGGCVPPAFFDDVYTFKLQTAVQAINISASGPGLTNAQAGQTANILISALDAEKHLIDWAINLQNSFDVAIVNIDNSQSSTKRSQTVYTKGTIQELGGGQYQIQYKL